MIQVAIKAIALRRTVRNSLGTAVQDKKEQHIGRLSVMRIYLVFAFTRSSARYS